MPESGDQVVVPWPWAKSIEAIKLEERLRGGLADPAARLPNRRFAMPSVPSGSEAYRKTQDYFDLHYQVRCLSGHPKLTYSSVIPVAQEAEAKLKAKQSGIDDKRRSVMIYHQRKYWGDQYQTIFRRWMAGEEHTAIMRAVNTRMRDKELGYRMTAIDLYTILYAACKAERIPVVRPGIKGDLPLNLVEEIYKHWSLGLKYQLLFKSEEFYSLTQKAVTTCKAIWNSMDNRYSNQRDTAARLNTTNRGHSKESSADAIKIIRYGKYVSMQNAALYIIPLNELPDNLATKLAQLSGVMDGTAGPDMDSYDTVNAVPLGTMSEQINRIIAEEEADAVITEETQPESLVKNPSVEETDSPIDAAVRSVIKETEDIERGMTEDEEDTEDEAPKHKVIGQGTAPRPEKDLSSFLIEGVGRSKLRDKEAVKELKQELQDDEPGEIDFLTPPS